MLDLITLQIDQLSAGEFFLWFLFILIGLTILGVILLVEAGKINPTLNSKDFEIPTDKIHVIPVDDTPVVLETKVLLAAHKKPKYPTDDDVLTEEESEEEDPLTEGLPV